MSRSDVDTKVASSPLEDGERFPHSVLAIQIMLTCASYLVYRAVRYLVACDDAGRRGIPGLGSPVAVYFGGILCRLMSHLSIMWALNRYFGLVPLDRSGELIVRALVVFALTVGTASLSRYALDFPVQQLRRFVLKPSIEAS